MVSPLLKGWQSNVLDHHYSKNMYFLKAASDILSSVVEPVESKNVASSKGEGAGAADEGDLVGDQTVAPMTDDETPAGDKVE
jgi:hypothetical protein